MGNLKGANVVSVWFILSAHLAPSASGAQEQHPSNSSLCPKSSDPSPGSDNVGASPEQETVSEYKYFPSPPFPSPDIITNSSPKST